MDAFGVGTVWFTGLFSGVWIALGITEALTGRVLPVFNLSRINWSVSEARLRGLAIVVQGVALGVYGLIGGLSFVAHVIPLFWVGHWWGMFVSAPLLLIIWGAVLFMALIEQRHKRAWPFKRDLAGHS
jgi:hypothetical protein